MMNIHEIVLEILENTEHLKQPCLGDEEVLLLSSEIVAAIEPIFQQIIEMRYAQRSYFRRRNEDNLSRAKRLEILVDVELIQFDRKRNIPIQIEAFPINY